MKRLIPPIALCLLSTNIIAGPIYNYICGNSEDGCSSNPTTCVCIAADPSGKSFCLSMIGDPHCVRPNQNSQQCASNQINEKTEGHCLAVVWQSEASPACQALTPPTTTVPHNKCAEGCTTVGHCAEISFATSPKSTTNAGTSR